MYSAACWSCTGLTTLCSFEAIASTCARSVSGFTVAGTIILASRPSHRQEYRPPNQSASPRTTAAITMRIQAFGVTNFTARTLPQNLHDSPPDVSIRGDVQGFLRAARISVQHDAGPA